MERASSSDDDDDLQTLVPQHESKSPIRRSSFEIGDATEKIDHGFWSKKRYFIAVSLPIVLVLLYLSLPVGKLFGGISIVTTASDSPTSRMRESELRALYLLRNQQLSLLSLWNQTLASPNTRSDVSPSPSGSPDAKAGSFDTVKSEQLRSALLDQIKLNRQIQNAILSAHRTKNSTVELPFDDNVGPDMSGLGSVDVCKRVDWPKDRRTIEWRPRKDRYLFAICISGQMSNHLICLEKHMFFAALLGRTLVFPSHKLDYRYDEVLDLEHINECFGRKVVMSFDDFAEMKKNKLSIDRFICYIASPPCFMDEEHTKRLKDLGITLGKIEAAWPEDAKSKKQKKRVVGDITPKFSSDDEVIAIGDMFYADVEEEWVMQPGGPLAHKCKALIQPSRLIILTAQRFVQTFLGSNFIALHFRRHGFLKFCNVKEESCFFPVPQAAECMLRVVERANAPVIYLSTDAAESETDLLQSLLVPNGDKPVPLVKRPSHTSVEKWDALLYRNKLGGNSQVEAMLDKTICAMSRVFIGAPGSTFTDDIIRLRRGWGSVSQCDENLCQGEQPNFIAENE
ncbi:uncharacterized protein M6B38_272235 [Iris pallida]|uniref:GDP-fucose protein O-fucosyltransferase 2 n=1 Tax=Iris pallida TaxID=29817 RepID=A0AAX6I6Y7_IRIPA|nr:uncharacterized protein M6B38_272235 [Iris pallida]